MVLALVSMTHSITSLPEKFRTAIEIASLVNPGVLQHFSKATGGVAYFPDSKNTVASISTQIARDLREQYTLGFAPEKANNAHAFRKIEVKVSAPGQGKLHARTRAGYSAAGDKSSDAEAEKGAE